MNLILLDTGPLGMISNPNATPANLQCYRWADALIAAGHRVVVPEIADFEGRRELLRLGRTKGIARLDLMQQ